MTLAVMTRATRGHTGRNLSADHGTNAIYLLVTLAAVTRIAAAFAADWAMPLLIVSAGFWITALMGFVLGYGPMLLSRPNLRCLPVQVFGVERSLSGLSAGGRWIRTLGPSHGSESQSRHRIDLMGPSFADR